MKPLVSIIIPTYNRARFLPETLESALGQTVTDIECIVVDDGSLDDTPAILERFLHRDPRVRYLMQQNRGPSAARNYGLNESRGRFIQFLDSDDIIVQKKLELQVHQLCSNNDLALSYCDYRYCAHDDLGKEITRDNFPPPRFIMEKPLWDIASRWESELTIPIHCFLFDARFFKERCIRFDETLKNHEDWDCWMQIFALSPKVFHVPEVLAIYRLHNDSICVDHEKLAIYFDLAIRKQQVIFRSDIAMRRLLEEKLNKHKTANSVSKKLTLHAKIYKILYQIFRNHTPWPIQKAIIKASRKK